MKPAGQRSSLEGTGAEDLLTTGMTDAELESVCAPGSMGLAPWIHWPAEHYSLGKCLRRVAWYPTLLPLYVYADHGPGLESRFYPHERDNDARVHLTFHPDKAARNREQSGKRILRIPHPWILYRKLRGLDRVGSPRGTLVFVPHGTPGFRWENHLSESYFSLLRSLPQNRSPIVLCLHMHDVHAGVHRHLRRFGFPLVSAGNTNSPLFVDRFYDIARRFACATSQSWGSQVAYCVELGLPFFFLGERPRLVNVAHDQLELGEVGYHDEHHRQYEEQAERLFRAGVEAVTPDQDRFVRTILGLDASTTRWKLSWVLWSQFFVHWHRWWPTWLTPVLTSIRKRGLAGSVRRLRERARGSAR